MFQTVSAPLTCSNVALNEVLVTFARYNASIEHSVIKANERHVHISMVAGSYTILKDATPTTPRFLKRGSKNLPYLLIDNRSITSFDTLSMESDSPLFED